MLYQILTLMFVMYFSQLKYYFSRLIIFITSIKTVLKYTLFSSGLNICCNIFFDTLSEVKQQTKDSLIIPRELSILMIMCTTYSS